MNENMTLAQAREHVLANRNKGVTCPCCQQFAKEYRRPLTSSMAYALILIRKYFRKNTPGEAVHVPSLLAQMAPDSPLVRGGDWAKLRYWGFIVEAAGNIPENQKSAGRYFLTQTGCDFVDGHITAPAAVFLYNESLLRFEHESLITIKDALGTKFNYAELMKPV